MIAILEHWIEANLFCPVEVQDDILLGVLLPYVRKLERKGTLLTWHYFREPEIRFRIRLRTKAERSKQRAAFIRIARGLFGKGAIAKWNFGDHGVEGEQYVGEEDRYGKEGWKVAQEYFHRGSETALALIALKKTQKLENPLWGEGRGNPWEGGEANPWRDLRSGPLEFHWSRFVHLFSNQLGFDMVEEAELSERQAERYRRVVKEFGMRW